MKQLLIILISLYVLVVVMVQTGCMTPEECKEYKASPIAVKVKFYAHNLKQGESLKYYISYGPCGENSTGNVNGTGVANNFGEYESDVYAYNLDNTFDDIYASTDYIWSESHNSKYQYTAARYRYDTLKFYDNQVFTIDFDYSPGVVHNYWEYARTRLTTTMKYCYSLPYYMLFGEPPGNITKQMLYDKMTKEAGYKLREEGPLTPYLYLQDGDILVFGESDIPNPANAPHYAIVIGNQIWHIFPWSEGGEFDGPRDLAYFKNRPDLINPYTGNVFKPINNYSFIQIYNK